MTRTQPKVRRSCAPPSILTSYIQARRSPLFRTLYPLAVPHPQRELSSSSIRIPIHPSSYHLLQTSHPDTHPHHTPTTISTLPGFTRSLVEPASSLRQLLQIPDEAERLDCAGAARLLAEPCLPAHRHAARQRLGGRPGSARDPRHPTPVMPPRRPHHAGSCRPRCRDNSALPALASNLAGPCPTSARLPGHP